ncbi:TetR/AcrR family transcriptional regulator [Alkalicella caledoniensis]|uniref:TetR/AcrR family transcriptional regulator n=1 Tax=Alkalicella caledoniensis TaxID=2731377 RepID=A0A7G9W6F8_ALKCA|nr:TetR/AcrR family transcriptional regulator [Alkalicella caledoniensis]QNO14270.1 TetR/AcrR family transcriptional regulator [Alkalicella caledoniensis]
MARPIDPDKHEKIRDAAIQLFYEQGINDTSIQQIAKAAGIAKGTIYLYYKDRESLIEDVVGYCYKQHLTFSMVGVKDQVSCCNKLKLRVRNFLFWTHNNPKEAAVIRSYYVPVNLNETENVFFEQSYSINKKIIQEGLDKGEIKQLPIDFICKIFFSLVEGMSTYAKKNPAILKNELLLEKMLDTLIDSIRNK